ncbi:glycosyltransferase [Corynebacterium suedekumii]|nr:glycosyltransferase [Corynebacterium suedekumii]
MASRRFCHTLVRALRDQGHTVDLYAARGSHGHVPDVELPGVEWGELAREATDTGYPPGARELEDAAFARLREYLATQDYDIIHNNSLHPALFTPGNRLPLVTTLHTPALPEVQSAIAVAGAAAGRFAAVSEATAGAWELQGTRYHRAQRGGRHPLAARTRWSVGGVVRPHRPGERSAPGHGCRPPGGDVAGVRRPGR